MISRLLQQLVDTLDISNSSWIRRRVGRSNWIIFVGFSFLILNIRFKWLDKNTRRYSTRNRFNFHKWEFFLATSMLVADVGNLCWWQVSDFDARLEVMVYYVLHRTSHQHNDPVKKSWNCHHCKVTNITLSSTWLWTVSDNTYNVLKDKNTIFQQLLRFYGGQSSTQMILKW